MLLVKPNTLSESQCRELEKLITITKEIKVYRRAKVIMYRNAGYTAEEIHEHTEYSERTQQYWLGRYREEGIAGLFERPRSGRPLQPPQQSPAEPDTEPDAESDAEPEVESDAGLTAGSDTEPDTEPEAGQTGPQLGYWERVTLAHMHAHHPKMYMRDRARMVFLRDNGSSEAMIAKLFGVQVRTVRQVLANYDQEGLAGLYRKPGSGRVSRLSGEQWQQVKEWVSKGPKALGYRFVKWTTRSLRWYIEKRFTVTFSREWIRQRLHRFTRYSWTRGKKVYAYPNDVERNTERKRFSQKMLTYLKLAQKGEIILLFEDESIFTLFGEVGYSWSPVGTTQEVPSAGQRGRVVVFGAADPQLGRTHYRIEEENIHQESTLRFVKQLVHYYQRHSPGMPLVLVLDKHPGHTSQLVEDFVKEQEHVTLENTPTQSADLNPIEHIWDWLAEQMIKNAFFETKDTLKKAIRHFFCYIAGIKEQVISWLGDLQKLYSAEAGRECEI